jgi:hypothetical protein
VLRFDGIRRVRSGMQGFDEQLIAVPRIFPSLQVLSISISGEIENRWSLGGEQTMVWQIETFLGHINYAVAKMFCE